jgi:hypothetical protein
MRRIIFLDVDGVLNNTLTEHFVHWETADDVPKGQGFYGMDPTLVKNFQTLVEKSGAEVVLSSTWRKRPFGLGKTERVARRQGYAGPRWIDVTPEHSLKGHERGHQIQDWLDANIKKDEQVEFIIIDDTPDMAHLYPRLVHTDAYEGLTEAKVTEALKLFGIEG